jgi:hypothetical protein
MIGVWRRFVFEHAQFELLNDVFNVSGQPILSCDGEQYHSLCQLS